VNPVPAREGGCHCGAVRFRTTATLGEVLECNCSICAMKGTLHWIVERSTFELLRGAESLETYRFNTRQAQHHFCKICGISPYYIARSHPDKIDINARCVDGVDVAALRPVPFDGQNWEAAYAALDTDE
jgi:hypothetical protein